MAYMKKAEAERLLDLLVKAHETVTDMHSELESLSRENMDLRHHNLMLQAALNVAVGATEKFPRYRIDDEIDDSLWFGVEDTTEGGYIASFATLEHAQEWLENHQEWLDSEPGTD